MPKFLDLRSLEPPILRLPPLPARLTVTPCLSYPVYAVQETEPKALCMLSRFSAQFSYISSLRLEVFMAFCIAERTPGLHNS